MTPYYSDAFATIYLGGAKTLVSDLQFDFIVTDPPYGINHPTNYHARGRDKLAKCADYIPVKGDNEPFDPEWLLSLNKPTVLWGGNHYASRLPDKSGWIVWDKMRPHTLDQATAELAWTNYVKGVRVFRHMWNGMIRASERGKGVLTHPTQKPVALNEWILGLKWTPQGTVLDPYMGTGSLLVAAKNLGRKATGIEIEESYCEIAAKRLSEIKKEINEAY